MRRCAGILVTTLSSKNESLYETVSTYEVLLQAVLGPLPVAVVVPASAPRTVLQWGVRQMESTKIGVYAIRNR